mmetsp:Transcript_21740/g.31538  ORF Transcript_21740/g.31538 Transcript_21740/m.31538 type:complete len:258 (-) Transcript_21740:196-969(-)|eukprot:CAMPEP_0113942350 /NCGR_PEP_ID=MMETSP1339-20121228/8078_1 /TAXON_ID=94617 /ORGANISM="Fibrocapsa japonica" /LENGTH=257 /DNA_ID=CAMNT_0000946785 /DNA_START=37 /DNA_END=810 /DNA_ORIENTATION=- /assembly_acc=CAM_ASM_000762
MEHATDKPGNPRLLGLNLVSVIILMITFVYDTGYLRTETFDDEALQVDISSSISATSLKAKSTVVKDEYVAASADEGWNQIKSEDNIKVLTKDHPTSDVKYLKTTFTAKCTTTEAIDVLHWKNWSKYGDKIDTTFESWEPVKTVSDVTFGRKVSKKMPLILGRDWSFGCYQLPKSGNTYFLACLSVEDDTYLPKSDDYVRGFQDTVITVTSLAAGLTEVQMLARADLGGNIPPWLFTSTVGTVSLASTKGIIDILES